MSDVSLILDRIRLGDRQASEQLLPLVYEELRRLAKWRLMREMPGQTLQATALVHEAYVRLVRPSAESGQTVGPAWDNTAHFYVAASEAMRRILIEVARKKKRRGGPVQELVEEPVGAVRAVAPHDLLDLDDALAQLAAEDPEKAQLVKLRFYAGMSMEDAAACLGISRATACRYWAYARAWLFERLAAEQKNQKVVRR